MDTSDITQYDFIDQMIIRYLYKKDGPVSYGAIKHGLRINVDKRIVSQQFLDNVGLEKTESNNNMYKIREQALGDSVRKLTDDGIIIKKEHDLVLYDLSQEARCAQEDLEYKINNLEIVGTEAEFYKAFELV